MSARVKSAKSDRNLLLTVGGVVLMLVVVLGIFAPKSADDDPTPTTTNNGPNGVKAVFLMLEKLGRSPSRWNLPLTELNGKLDDEQAQRTTLVLAGPTYDPLEQKELRSELARFMERGGRVLTTSAGAELLPGGEIKQAGQLQPPICKTTPEGPGPLARVGSVDMGESVQWSAEGASFEVAQSCGNEPVVVSYAYGKGEVIWWSSAWPMENAQLATDANLRLLLASVGDGRDVIFDESLHGATKTLWDSAKGLPLKWLALQCVLFFVLLIFSFSRRHGPLRSPVMLPRSSPVEFAHSMGDLYEKAGATSAATDAARRRLLRILTREAGVSQLSVQQGPEAIAEALRLRLGGDWSLLREHLARCQEARQGKFTPRSALALVRGLSDDAAAVRARLKTPEPTDAVAELVG